MRSALRLSALSLIAGVLAFPPGRTQARQDATLSADQARGGTFDALKFRDIGPAVTSGRLHDVVIDPKDPAVLYVAAATGGLWKSANKGVTWKPIFERQPDNTFGALAIFERDSKIIWAGTGEQNNRQSSSWGTGVYRSTDAGETWTHLGLRETRSIGRVVLDPNDPNDRPPRASRGSEELEPHLRCG